MNAEQLTEKDCTPKCRSRGHAYNILSCVTKAASAEIRAYCNWLCHNFSTVSDDLGRNVLHLASSCGKREIVEWLLDHCNCEVDVRDTESGWTALHRSLFYGHLSAARVLLSHAASMRMTDHDGLTPLDILLKDRLPHIQYLPADPSDVYVWGFNTNYNLGLGNAQNREYPEIIDSFRKDCTSIKQVVMCKYHSIFLSSQGQLFSCGHGYGGRLGQVSENTSVVPAVVHGVGSILCEQVAAGQDHIVLLMQGGQVWTCGLNLYHQLGHNPAPERLVSPKPLSLKFLKGKEVFGVCAARFHSVFYTNDSVFSFGLNAGQLGHPKGDRTQILPRQVSALYNKEWKVTHVVASDGATVCATNRGDVFVLHEYQQRKIASRQLGIKKISVVGGNLDSRCEAAGLREGGGLELTVAILTESGKIFLWRQTDQFLRRCLFTPGRQLIVSDIHLNHYTVGLITNENEAFSGTILPVKNKKKPVDGPPLSLQQTKPQNTSGHLSVLLDRDECNFIRAKRIPYLHRATSITCDAKGKNFAVLQSSPKMGLLEIPEVTESSMCEDMKCLLEEVHAHDNFHDITIKVEEKYYPAHKFILTSRCEYFHKLFQCNPDLCVGKPTVSVEGIKSEAFEQILKFIYTNTCDFITEGFEIKEKLSISSDVDKIADHVDLNRNETTQVSKAKKKSKSKSKNKDNLDIDPLRNIQKASKRLNMPVLTKQLECVKLVNTRVKLEYANSLPKLKFDRQKFSNLCDVTLSSQDGVKLPCHRCILAARLEYFHSMLGSCWMESSSLECLSLPISSSIIEVILDFVYTGSAPGVFASEDPEFLCHVLVVADQFLIVRLKEMCEFALADLLTLKNAPELLQLSFVYNAVQLKVTCMEYICINLPAIIESKGLDVLSSEVMDTLSHKYRSLVPSMCRRFVTPYSDSPAKDELKEIEKSFPVSKDCDIIRQKVDSTSSKGHEVKPGKGRRRTLSLRSDVTSGDQKCLESSEKDIVLNITASPLENHVQPKPKAPEPVQEPVPHVEIKNQSQNPSFQKAEQVFFSTSRTKEFPELGEIICPEKKGPRVMPKPVNPHTDFKRTSHISQKQKKMMLLSNKDQFTSGPPSVSPSSFPASKAAPPCPWGKQESQDVPSQSFWDIVPKGESHSLLEISSPGGSSSLSSPASPTSDIVKTPCSSSAGTRSSENHGGQPLLLTLDAIQRAEQEALHSLVQPKTKSLHLINIEDQAIEELIRLYRVKDNPNERITISRVLPDKIATPVWKKKHT